MVLEANQTSDDEVAVSEVLFECFYIFFFLHTVVVNVIRIEDLKPFPLSHDLYLPTPPIKLLGPPKIFAALLLRIKTHDRLERIQELEGT